MAVLARDDVTLATITDIAYMRRYYLLQLSNLAAPPVPSTNPPTGSWSTTEATYTEGSTNSLYVTDLIVFSDGTFDYLPVQKSSSYEAAKVAYNKAVAAQTAANNALTSANGRNYNITKLTDATGTINPDTGLALVRGDVWNKVDSYSTYNALAKWEWDGSAWKPAAITSNMITNLDVLKLSVAGSAHINQAVINKIVADIGYFNSIVTGSLIADSIAAAIANIVKARVENLTVTEGASIATAVINKLAAQLITSSRLQSDVDPATNLMSVMDNQGYRLINVLDPASPREVVRLGPSGDNILSVGLATISNEGNISGNVGSFAALVVDGNPFFGEDVRRLPRGVVAQQKMLGGQGVRANMLERAYVIWLGVFLPAGRLYKVRSSSMIVRTESSGVAPMLNLHVVENSTTTYPDSAWDASRKAESHIGAFPGFRSLPSMEEVIDLRSYQEGTEVYVQAAVSIHDLANVGWCQVAATVHPAYLWIEDIGTSYHTNGVVYYSEVLPPTPQRTVKRYTATEWATYRWQGPRVFATAATQGRAQVNVDGVIQPMADYDSLFFFPPEMQTDLLGATIESIKLRAMFGEWFYGSSGVGAWTWHGYSTPPASNPTHHWMRDTPEWPRWTAREIWVAPSEFPAWASGARRGFGFAGANTTQPYSGWLTQDTSAMFIDVVYYK